MKFAHILICIAIAGIMLCPALYLWQATPLLLASLGPAVFAIAVITLSYVGIVLFVGSVFFFVWLWGLLDEQFRCRALRKQMGVVAHRQHVRLCGCPTAINASARILHRRSRGPQGNTH